MPAIQDTAFAAYRKLSEQHPGFNKRGACEIGTPEHALILDFLALDAVAASRSTGIRPRKSELKRAEAVIRRLGLLS